MACNWYKKADGFGDDEGYIYIPRFNRGRMKPEKLTQIVRLLDEVFAYERDVGRAMADAVISELSPVNVKLRVNPEDIESSYYQLTEMLVDEVANLAMSDRFPAHPKAKRISRRRNSSIREAAALEKLSRMAAPGGPISVLIGRNPELSRQLQNQLRAQFANLSHYAPPPIEVSPGVEGSRVFKTHFDCLISSLRHPGGFDECMGREMALGSGDIGEFPGNEVGDIKVSPAEAFDIEAQGAYTNWMPNLVYSERNRLAQIMRDYINKKSPPPPSEDPFALWYIDRVRSGKMPLFKTMLGGPNMFYRYLQSVDSLRNKQRRYEAYKYANIAQIAIGTWNFILDSLIKIGEQRYGDRFQSWMDANERLLRRM